MIFRTGIAVDLYRAASGARRVLDKRAVKRIAAFIQTTRSDDGGFSDRGGNSDLYYALFGLTSTRVLRQPIRRRALDAYLDGQDVEALDLIHLACLVQCRRLRHPLGIPRRLRPQALAALARFRTADGGFAEQEGRPQATRYGNYLAVLAHEVLGSRLPDREQLAVTASHLLSDSLTGSQDHIGLSAMVSGILVADALGCEVPVDQAMSQIHRFRHASGGFLACSAAPLPDLLSTAVAAFAQRRLGRAIDGEAAAETAAFVQNLWHDSGGFRAGEHEDAPDCEYTFYGLLALGSLRP